MSMALARGQITIVSELDRLAGLRNLVVGGRRAIGYTDSPTSPGWLHRRWQLSTLRPSSKREYCLGALVEVTQGRTDSISAILYDTASGSGRWTHNEIRASYDYTQGGRQWLTWSFPPYASWPDGERLANQLIIYAGRAGHTQGIGITVSELCLLEGDVAPSSWIPAPEDVEADAMATARVQTITRHRDLVGIERDRLHEIYRKLRTDKRTPQDLGLRLEHLWISCSGAHAELDRACAAAIASPTDESNEAVNRLTGVYKTKVIDMQRGIQEVEQAIREHVYSEARGKTRVRVEGKGLDPNKYYPIIIKTRPNPAYPVYGVRLERGLYQRELGVPPYASHSYGFDLRLEWSFVSSGWGAAAEDRKIYAYSVRHVRASEPPLVSRPKQEMRASWEYVYVRGGSDYYVEVTGATDLDIQLYPEGAYWEGSTGSQYSYRWEVLESIDALGEPKVDLDVLSDRLLAEIARERGELRQAIESARVATRADYEARVQGVLAQVSQLEGLMRDGQAVLQRQIDRQVERWYGSEIAQSGVPPTSLWPASDNAKHEGDTYTCVAPRGITINPANAAQYPNVGKSWRWTNGGSGTTYGWELIADTDITQALALASRAQATADGKMTHYITPTPPVAYQQGDQWTLPAPWLGRKGGKAHTYPEGTILTATADSISGQHHPEHWVELVRYTDLSLEDIKLGGRNLYVGGSESPVLRPNNTGLGTTSTLNEGDLRYSRITPDASKAISVYSHIIPELVEEGVIYSMSVYIRHQHTTPVDVGLKTASGYTRTTISPGQWVLWREEGVRPIPSGRLSLIVYAHTGLAIDLRCLMVERGNKSSDWTPAPEDVQAEIEARSRELKLKLDEANKAITKAQDAADNAKRQADIAKSAAESNDGKIDEAESRGIAKAVQAYQQSLQVEWERLKAGYEALKASEYLADKTALTSAYSTAKQRYDALLARITSILSDSKVSAQEYSQYTAAYAAYQPSAKTLADAIETAGKAIQAELLKRADEAAKGRVDAIKVGARNLALQSGEQPAKEQAGYNIIRGRISQPWMLAGVYSITARVSIMTDNPSPEIWMYPNRGESSIGRAIGTDIVSSNGWVTATYQLVGKVIEQVHLRGDKRDYGLWCGTYNGVNAYRTQVHWVMIEEGNKPSAWQPALEDLDEEAQRKADEAEARAKAEAERRAAEAEQRAKAEARRAAEEAERRAKEHAERQIAHMDYLKQVLKRGTTQIQGGAVLGQYIAVADLEQVVRGYISGMLNGAFLAAGVSNHGTPQETRNVEISHDGDGHFGQLHFCGSGQDGRVDLIRPGEADPYLSLGGVLRPIQEVLLDAELRDTYVSNQADVDAYPLALSGLTRELKVFSVLRDGASCRVSGQLGSPSIRFNGAGDSQQSQRVTITTEILLQRQQPSGWIDVAVMGDTWVSGDSSQDSWSEPAKVIDLRLPNLHKGQYRLLARSRYSDNYYQLQVISQIRIMPLTILVERVSSVQQVAFTEHGFRAFYGPRRYVDIASEGDYVLSARGATDIPGVLAAGRVSRDGIVTTSWGAYCKRPGYDTARAVKHADNSYTVYHSIGHGDYIVQLTTEDAWNTATYYDIRPNSFRVRLMNPTQSFYQYFPNPFSYVCIGENK